MEQGENIFKLQNELVSMPEYLLELKLLTLDVSLYVFQTNYTQLINLLNIYKDKQKALILWDENNRHIQDEFHLEVIRLLHNFVASVKSLIDHTRIMYQELYEGNKKFPEYQQEVNKLFANNPLAQFVEDLRDYSLHYKFLPISSKYIYVKDPPKDESSIVLDLKILLLYKTWSALSKNYLKEQRDNINILDLISKYYGLTIGFHKWVRSKQLEIHSEEFKRLNEKKRQLADLLIPEEVIFALADFDTNKTNPDKSFWRILEPTQRDELSHIPLGSPEHADKLISLIENKANISSELKSKIKDFYKQFLN